MIIEIDKENSSELRKYVDECVEDDILKTFNVLWDERNYWNYKPLIYKVDNKLVAFAAYTIDEKYPGKLKVYYLHTHEEYRGQGVAKKLMQTLADIAVTNKKDMLYITEVNTAGSKLFKNIKHSTRINEFNTVDNIYDIPCEKLIDFFIK